MKQDIAVELLKIAAELATASVAHKATTESSAANKIPKIETTFADCVTAVRAQFDQLLRGAE